MKIEEQDLETLLAKEDDLNQECAAPSVISPMESRDDSYEHEYKYDDEGNIVLPPQEQSLDQEEPNNVLTMGASFNPNNLD